MNNENQGTLINTPKETTLVTENTDKLFLANLDKPPIEKSKCDFQVHCPLCPHWQAQPLFPNVHGSTIYNSQDMEAT